MKTPPIWLAIAAAMLFGLAGSAMATTFDIVPEPVSGTPTPEGPNWRWTYTAQLHPLQRIEAGDWFTIYDFNGFTGVHSEPAGWVFTSSNIGVTPSDVIPVDNPTIPNLTWTWTGSTIIPTGQSFTLGQFSAVSMFNTPVLANFVSRGTKDVPGLPADGTKISNVGMVAVPVSTIPEPTTMTLTGLGLMAVALYTLQQRKSA